MYIYPPMAAGLLEGSYIFKKEVLGLVIYRGHMRAREPETILYLHNATCIAHSLDIPSAWRRKVGILKLK